MPEQVDKSTEKPAGLSKRILRYWCSTEIFTLPDVPAALKSNDRKIIVDLRPGDPLPWNGAILGGPVRRHTLYFFIVEKEAVAELLAKLSRSDEYRERVPGDTCLSALNLDHRGVPGKWSYSGADFAYGIHMIREKGDLTKVTDIRKKAMEEYWSRFRSKNATEADEGEMEMTVVDWGMLKKELDHLRNLVKGRLAWKVALRCVTEQVSAPNDADLEAPFLSSYYIKDLNRLIQTDASLGRPLEKFLLPEVNFGARVNLLDPQAILERVHPKRLPEGRWPSNPSQGLYAAQQAAINEALANLGGGGGLLGINGPPGTGKTTLLKEVIVDVIVNKARRLLDFNVSKIFSRKKKMINDLFGFFPLNPDGIGDDGIVVSSNNNMAVENISKELPALASIDSAFFDEAAYFPDVASLIQGGTCWGMLCAVLGKSSNRGEFLRKFWWDPKGFRSYLKAQHEDPAVRDECERGFADAGKELKALLQAFEGFQKEAGEYHERLVGMLIGRNSREGEIWEGGGYGGGGAGEERAMLEEVRRRLALNWEIPMANVPGLSFPDLSMEDIHLMMPYSSEKMNILRSRIFLKSLELIGYAIRVNARFFQSNLHAFVMMISGKYAELFDEEMTLTLWNSFFFCVPVVSVTLASVEKQFTRMRAGSVGWLLLDEAGQATPSSVCGALWRCRRCIVIGDTMQIQPIVTIPRDLDRILRERYQVPDDRWSPIRHSAQSLADRVTSVGTYIYESSERVTWTGIPLRAHRRCGEPMFSIANTIAYGGQMVNAKMREIGDADGREGNGKGAAGAPNDMAVALHDIPAGPSGWIDVVGVTVLQGHAIAEELQVVRDLLTMLAGYAGRIFVISPFRSVADLCKERFHRAGRVDCGTIHSFQGKEAEIVILVLGTGLESRVAREWAAASPHILNVALTRAKERIYVIGNRQAWEGHDYFSYLARKLPKKEPTGGRLF
jgi:hypothetical protein